VGDDGGYEEGGLQQWWLWGGWVATMKMIERERHVPSSVLCVFNNSVFSFQYIFIYIKKNLKKSAMYKNNLIFSFVFVIF
jgi:hypothetical protein